MATNADIMRAIGTLEGKLDGHLAREKLREERADAIEKRVTTVEKHQWYHSGVVAMLAIVFAKIGIPLPLPKF
jgi:hypothetical protein